MNRKCVDSAHLKEQQLGAGNDIERCRREIAAIEAQLLAGHPDVAGLCLALSDWSAELRILQDEKRRQDGPGGVKGSDHVLIRI